MMSAESYQNFMMQPTYSKNSQEYVINLDENLPDGDPNLQSNKDSYAGQTNLSSINEGTPVVFDYDPKKNPLNLDSWKNAIHQGFFPNGQRSNALMILAATLKGKGFKKEGAYYNLKSAADLQAQRYGVEKFDKTEIWDNIVE